MLEPNVVFKLNAIKEKIEKNYQFDQTKVDIEKQIYDQFYEKINVSIADIDTMTYKIRALEYDLLVTINLSKDNRMLQKIDLIIHF